MEQNITVSILCRIYPQTSNINRALVGNEIADHSDVVGAAPLHLHCRLNTWLQWIGTDNSKTRREKFKFGGLVRFELGVLWYCMFSMLQLVE